LAAKSSALSKKTFPKEELRARGDAMFGVVGLLSVIVGAVAAYASDRYPAFIEALETAAGILVLGGFAVAGYTLSTFIIV
jgi:hypothetical protein